MKPTYLDSLDTIANAYDKALEWECKTCNKLGATYYVEYFSEAIGRKTSERICATCLRRRSGLTLAELRGLRDKLPYQFP